LKRVACLFMVYILISETTFAWTIPEHLKNAIVLIQNPKNNTYGTGFIVEKGESSFLVTCKHVIEGIDTAFVKFAEETERNEVRISANGIPLFLKRDGQIIWKAHSNKDIDIAIIPMLQENFGGDAKFKAIGFQFLVTDSTLNYVGINEGDDVLLIGFSFISGQNLPSYHVARKGILSLLTRDRIYYSVDRQLYHENIYLVDVNLFPGDSGAPVFVEHKGQIYVLGMAFLLWTKLGKSQLVIPPDTLMVEQTQYMDLGLVIPAQRIREVIDSVGSAKSGM
jgi:S1-C subfamily serine protease